MAVNIMIQGTMSNAGKSVIAAGLCRIFTEDGYRVAPFKSQNMSLNSYVTDDGLEMGRAQAVQAQACGVKPVVEMNPVLLKPTTDVGSQMIVMGKVRADMKASDYFKYKKQLIPEILDAYNILAANNDIIVIEGAGSPAEINLKADDIVNMGLAKLVGAPVLLVGDIDRGGVFAQLAGTVMLLEEDERARIKGMIINKFRGDVSILKPGLVMIEKICKKPVLGVVPYERLNIDDEDSLSGFLENDKGRFSGFSKQDADDPSGFFRQDEGRLSGSSEKSGQSAAPPDIAVIRLPRISNFTDFAALTAAGARVRFAHAPAQLAGADVIVLPGTKSTMADLEWLRRTGLAAEIVRRGRAGAIVLGVCGGYQMMGQTLSDPNGVETGAARTVAGLGLLPVKTVFESEKILKNTTGRISQIEGSLAALSGTPVSGYEIHTGRTSIVSGRSAAGADTAAGGDFGSAGGAARSGFEAAGEAALSGFGAAGGAARSGFEAAGGAARSGFEAAGGAARSGFEACRPLAELADGRLDGCVLGNAAGTYLHGIFDDRGFTERLLKIVAERKGLNAAGFKAESRAMQREREYDRLAQIIRNSLNMDEIYKIMGLSKGK